MGMVRMFHVSCDVCYEQVDGDQWYARQAEQRAKDEGLSAALNGFAKTVNNP